MPVIVATQHNDNQRTGANLQETALRVDNVNVGQFGKLLEFPVDGQVYGQPLYVPNAIGARNVVYVATMHNSVYAFDADEPPGPPAPPPPLWSRNLGPSVPLPDSAIGGGAGYRDLQTEIGILSTPVVSLPHNAIYAVAFTKETDGFHYRLHALDLQTGRELFGGPRTIEASADGSGAGSVNGRILFQSHLQNQRPALLLSNGAIYVCFASFGDHGDYHGWVLGYDAGTLAPLPDAANLTANCRAGGIWQAGQGPAADTLGNIYVMTGNGDFNERTLGGKVTLNESALGGPAAANIDDTLIALAWTGQEAQRRLNVAVSSDGRQFTGKVTLEETSVDSPALAFANSRLYLAWTGTDDDRRVNICSSLDQTRFSNKVTLDEPSSFGPALAFGNGRLYLAWVGRGLLHRLHVMSSADGVTWENRTVLSERATAAPSLGFIGGKLYLSWAGTDWDHSLNVLESTDGIAFGNKKTFPDHSRYSPALAHDGEFQMMWAGRDRGQALRLMSGAHPRVLGNTQTYDDRGAAAPALVMFQGALHALWTGDETLRRLNIAQVTRTPSLGDCIVRLGPDLAISDWFTPWNTLELNDIDNDLGSGGVLLLPGTDLLAGGGKEGKLYLLRRGNLGRFCSGCHEATGETRIVQSFQATAKRRDSSAPRPAPHSNGFHHIHGSPVYWNSPHRGPMIYVWGEADRAKAFAFGGSKFDPVPADMSLPSVVTPAGSMPGAMLSLSADGSRPGTGILWASHPTKEDANHGVVDGTLRALDATDLKRELWNSDQAAGQRDVLGMIAKFSVPTVANGRVYAATFSNKVVVYGPLA